MKSSDQEDDLNIQEIWVNTLTDNHTIYHTTDKEISKFERNSTKNSQTMERIVLKTREGKDSAVMVLYDSGASKTFCSLSLAKAVAEDLRKIEHKVLWIIFSIMRDFFSGGTKNLAFFAIS